MVEKNLENLFCKVLKLISDDNYSEVEIIIANILNDSSYKKDLNVDSWQYIADIYLTLGKYASAIDAYKKAKNQLGVVFCSILLKNLEEAENLLIQADKSSAKNWCMFLIELFKGNINKRIKPTFFQIRHFLELTVYHLLVLQNNEYLNCILSELENLSEINLDSKKAIAAAYFHAGKLDIAQSIFMSLANENQYDGEIFFNLGQIHLQKNNYQEAVSMFMNALLLLPEHYPSKLFLQKANALLKTNN